MQHLISNHNSSTPLFLYVAYQAPHEPVTRPPPKYLRKYDNIKQRSAGGKLNRFATITVKQRLMINSSSNICFQALDESVGNIIKTLKKNKMYKDSLIIFSTDNGGSSRNFSNYPLRGMKEDLYEGGVKGIGWVSGGLIRKQKSKKRSQQKKQ